MTADFTEFSVRYAIICAILVVVVYLLVSLAGLAKIKWRQRTRQRTKQTITLDGDEVHWITPEQIITEEQASLPKARRAAPAPVPEPAPERTPAKFGEQLFRSGIEAELRQLRSELVGLKDNVAQLKAARRVSPQYNEAMRLAQRGIDAHGIADECGISMGEAELVLALSRNKQEYEDHE